MRTNFTKSNSSPYSPEQVFLSRLLEFKKTLVDDNYTNIRNISQSNHNFNQVFCYLKGIIRKLQINYARAIQRNQELERELKKVDPHNLILLKPKVEEKGLGEIGLKFNSFVPLKSKSADSFDLKVSQAILEPKLMGSHSKKVNRDDLRKQMRTIQLFIKNLSQSMVQDRQKQFSFPKQMLMNLYLRWNESKKRTPLINQSLIKSQLTNELKKTFPNIDHNEKCYRGIIFREDVVDCTVKQQKQLNRISQDGNSTGMAMEEEEVYWQLEQLSQEHLQLDNIDEFI